MLKTWSTSLVGQSHSTRRRFGVWPGKRCRVPRANLGKDFFTICTYQQSFNPSTLKCEQRYFLQHLFKQKGVETLQKENSAIWCRSEHPILIFEIVSSVQQTLRRIEFWSLKWNDQIIYRISWIVITVSEKWREDPLIQLFDPRRHNCWSCVAWLLPYEDCLGPHLSTDSKVRTACLFTKLSSTR